MDSALQDDDILEGLLETSVIDNILTQNITPTEDITAANNRIIAPTNDDVMPSFSPGPNYKWAELLKPKTINELINNASNIMKTMNTKKQICKKTTFYITMVSSQKIHLNCNTKIICN